MTEAEWLACEAPTPMLTFLVGKASERKLRLFACACCRRVPLLMDQPRIRKAVEVAERHADGQASDLALADANRILAGPWICDFDGVEAVGAATANPIEPIEAALAASIAANVVALSEAPPYWAVPTPEQRGAEHGAQATLLRDLIGNPFRHVAIEPTWQVVDVTALARAVCDERDNISGQLDPARLAVLSDALEEAGCTDASLLAHLRSPGPHVRGCWALDLVLGKS